VKVWMSHILIIMMLCLLLTTNATLFIPSLSKQQNPLSNTSMLSTPKSLTHTTTTEWKPDIIILNVTNGTISWHVYPEYSILNDTHILHRADVAFSSNDTLYIDKPTEWTFDTITPYTTVSYNATYIWFTVSTNIHYYVYYLSNNTWDYPEYRESRISFHNSKGESLDFDSFHTSVAVSPSRLIHYAPDINDPHIVAWWRLNEASGTKTTYDWKQSIPIQQASTTGWTTGYIGQCAYWGGYSVTSLEIGLPSYGIVYKYAQKAVLSPPFTVEFWVKYTSLYSGPTSSWEKDIAPFVFKGATGPIPNYLVGINVNTQKLAFIMGDTSNNTHVLYSSMTLIKCQWYHIVASYDGTYMRVYINGRLDNSTQDSFTVQTAMDTSKLDAYTFTLGVYSVATDYGRGTFYIDEVRLYDDILTPEEVWWHYSLSLYYDGQKDMLGRTSSGSVTSYTSGVFGTASEFDGIDDYIQIDNDQSLLNLSSFTIVAYFKTGSIGTTQDILKKEKDATEEMFHLRIEVDGKLWFVVRIDGATYSTSQYQLSADTWYMAIVTFNTTAISLYVNGQLVGSTETPPSLLATATTYPYYIGRHPIVDYWFDGEIDELILLNQPLSPEMAENLWKIAKPYIGGYYTDTEFKASWPIESDSPKNDQGFSEDFSGISDISYSSNTTLTTDGDVANWTVPNGQSSTWMLWFDDMDWINPNIYPFIEFRYKTESNKTDTPQVVYYVDENADGTYDTVLKAYPSLSTSWAIFRQNIIEKLSDGGISVNSSTRVIIKLAYWSVDGYLKLYLDWLRVYGFENCITYGMGSSCTNKPNTYWSAMGGILHGHMEATGWSWPMMRFSLPDIEVTEGLYLEVRVRAGDDDSEADMNIKFHDTGGYLYAVGSDVNIPSTWQIYRYDLYDLFGSITLKDIELFNLGSDSDDIYYDYVRIGYLDNEKIQDTSWESLLYPIYEHPKSGYVWFNVTDIFGNSLIYEPRSYAVYQDFVLPLYSWKFMNGKDDSFIHINISRNGFHWSEWLAPHEITRYDLYNGTYTLRVTYPDSSYFETSITVTQDYFWWLEGDTFGDVLMGIDNLYYNITNMNQTLYNQIINVNISLTNWNSEINQTTVNIYLNLTNVNSTLGDLVLNNYELIKNLNTNMTNQFVNLDVNIYNNFTQISGQILSVNNTVLNINATIDYQHNQISTQITNLQTNMTYQINWVLNNITNVNSTIHAQLIDISTQITNLQDNITIQINNVSTQIDNVNVSLSQQINDISVQITNLQSHIDGQFSNIEVWLYNNFTQINSQVISVNNTILNVNSTIDYQHNQITTLIYNVQDNITTQINDVKTMITNLETSMDTQFDNIEIWMLNNFTEINAQVISVNDTILNVNATIDYQHNQLSLQITNLQDNFTIQINSIEANITNVNSTLSQQINDVYVLVQNLQSDMDAQFTNVEVWIYNNFTHIETQILSVNNTVININSTISQQISQVSLQITNLQTNVTTQFNYVFENITNVNATIHTQLISLSTEINNFWTNMNYTLLNMDVNINNNFSNIQTQIVTVNNTVLSVNSTLISANHTIINQITNLNNSMTYQFTHVITNITNVNNTLYQQTQTIKEDIVDLAHTEYRNPPPEPAKVPVVGDFVASEAGQVIAGFGIILAIIFAFMYVVERGRRISIEEERSAKRMINALKK